MVKEFVEVTPEEGESMVDFVQKLERLQKENDDVTYWGEYHPQDRSRAIFYSNHLPQVSPEEYYEYVDISIDRASTVDEGFEIVMEMQRSNPQVHYWRTGNNGEFLDAQEAIQLGMTAGEYCDQKDEEQGQSIHDQRAFEERKLVEKIESGEEKWVQNPNYYQSIDEVIEEVNALGDWRDESQVAAYLKVCAKVSLINKRYYRYVDFEQKKICYRMFS